MRLAKLMDHITINIGFRFDILINVYPSYRAINCTIHL